MKGSTIVYLPYDTITQYNMVTNDIARVTAPYQYVNWLGIGMELVALVFAVAAVATLHPTERGTRGHDASIVGSVATFVVGMILKWYYIKATESAIAQFLMTVNAQTMQTVRQVEEQLQVVQGFWGTAGPGAANVLCALAYLGLFIGALFTCQHYTVWRPPPAVPSRPAPELTKPVTEPSLEPAVSTKFCRFCGAKIVRDSDYCEECGRKLL